MKYAIFSDIHGNLEAYQAVLNSLKGEGRVKYICVGDIVGYGADPEECIHITKRLGPIVIAGNHDWAAVNKTALDYFNDYAKKAVQWTSGEINADEKQYLKALELIYISKDMTVVHGTLMRPEMFEYAFDYATAHRMLKLMETSIAFIGHTHVPGIFSLNKDRVEYGSGPTVKISASKKYLVNVGSIGQPRDGDPRASYCIWDTNSGKIEIRRVDYDIEKTQKKIIDAGLPEFLAKRLSEGR